MQQQQQQQQLPILHPLLQHHSCSGASCRCVTSVPHQSLLLPVPGCGAGAGFTAVQTRQHYVLSLLCHLDYSQFGLLIIQFITSMTEINCQEKRASTILTTWDWFSDPPKEKYPLLFPKLIQFLWTIFCSSSATISREANCWV